MYRQRKDRRRVHGSGDTNLVPYPPRGWDGLISARQQSRRFEVLFSQGNGRFCIKKLKFSSVVCVPSPLLLIDRGLGEMFHAKVLLLTCSLVHQRADGGIRFARGNNHHRRVRVAKQKSLRPPQPNLSSEVGKGVGSPHLPFHPLISSLVRSALVRFLRAGRCTRKVKHCIRGIYSRQLGSVNPHVSCRRQTRKGDLKPPPHPRSCR